MFAILLDGLRSGGQYFPRDGVSIERVKNTSQYFGIVLNFTPWRPAKKRIILVELSCDCRINENGRHKLWHRWINAKEYDVFSAEDVDRIFKSEPSSEYEDIAGFDVGNPLKYEDLPEKLVLLKKLENGSGTCELIQATLKAIMDNFDDEFALHFNIETS